MKQAALAILALLLGISIQAKNKFKFGKNIDLKLLAQTSSSEYPDADAEIIFALGEAEYELKNDQLKLVYSYHYRIKIYRSNAYQKANIEIPYLKYDDYETVSDIKANSYFLDENGEMVTVSLKKSDVYDQDLNGYYFSKNFSIPQVKEACIIEYTYKIASSTFSEFRTWYFQWDIPVKYSRFESAMLDYFIYKDHFEGNLISIAKEEESLTSSLGYGLRKSYTAENITPINKEPYVGTINDYRSRLNFYLVSFQPPNSYSRKVIQNWGDLAGSLTEMEQFWHQLTKNNSLKKVIEPKLHGLTDTSEIIKACYQTVLENITWNGNYDWMVHKDLKNSFEKKTGPSSNINMTLIHFLRTAGFEAYPVILSTRDHGRINSFIPMISQFNHVIACVEFDEGKVYLDATDENRPIGLLDKNDLNGKGMLIRENTYTWVELKNDIPNRQIVQQQIQAGEDGTIKGSITISESGYFGLLNRDFIKSATKEKYIEQLGLEYSIQIADASIENLESPESSLKTQLQITSDFHVYQDDQMIYLSPIIIPPLIENPAAQDQRELPMELDYVWDFMNIVNLSIPDGYEVLELPENISLVLPDDGGSLSCHSQALGKTVQILMKFKINKTFFINKDYLLLKEFFNEVISKSDEQIVLRKS